jgi:hypothetical protein
MPGAEPTALRFCEILLLRPAAARDNRGAAMLRRLAR